jgi:hypothetical protein
VSQSDSLGDLALHVRGLPHQNRPCPYRIDIELTPQLTARIPRTGSGVGGEVGISEFQVVGPQSRDGSLRLDIAITSAVMATTPRRVAILAMVAPGFRLGLAGTGHGTRGKRGVPAGWGWPREPGAGVKEAHKPVSRVGDPPDKETALLPGPATSRQICRQCVGCQA